MNQEIKKIASDILEAVAFLDSIDKNWYSLNEAQLSALKDKNSKIETDLDKRQKRLNWLYSNKFGPAIVARKKLFAVKRKLSR